jgi:hypothetical protein
MPQTSNSRISTSNKRTTIFLNLLIDGLVLNS